MKIITTYIKLFILVQFLSVVASGQVVLKKIYVNDHYIKCNEKSKCLQIKDSISNKWEMFSGSIENFHFEEGNFYQLLVEVHSTKKSPTDIESQHYVLQKILLKNKNDIADIFELDDIPWFLEKINSKKTFKEIKSVNAFIVFHPDENKIVGNAGCNKFNAKLELTDSSMAIKNISATKMQCKGTSNMIERELFEDLEVINYYKVKSKKLFLYDHKKLLLVFKLK